MSCDVLVPGAATTSSNASFGVGGTGKPGATKFVAECTGYVSNVEVSYKLNHTYNYKAQLYSHEGTYPSTAIGAESANVLVNGNSCTFYDFTLGTDAYVVNGTTYWIVQSNQTYDAGNWLEVCGTDDASNNFANYNYGSPGAWAFDYTATPYMIVSIVSTSSSNTSTTTDMAIMRSETISAVTMAILFAMLIYFAIKFFVPGRRQHP